MSETPRILRQSRRDDWLHVAWNVLFALGVYSAFSGPERFTTITRWSLISLIACTGVLRLYLILFTTGHLRLDGAGLMVRRNDRETFYAWSDIAGFKVGKGWFQPIVCFNLSEEGRRKRPDYLPPLREQSDHALMEEYGGLSAQALAELLNQSLGQAEAPPHAAHARVPA